MINNLEAIKVKTMKFQQRHKVIFLLQWTFAFPTFIARLDGCLSSSQFNCHNVKALISLHIAVFLKTVLKGNGL